MTKRTQSLVSRSAAVAVLLLCGVVTSQPSTSLPTMTSPTGLPSSSSPAPNSTTGGSQLDTSQQSVAFLVWVLGSVAAFLLLVSGCYVTLMWQQKAFREYKATFEEQLKTVSRIRRGVCEEAADNAMQKIVAVGDGALEGAVDKDLEGAGAAVANEGEDSSSGSGSGESGDDDGSGSEGSVDMAPAAVRARILGQKYVALKLVKQKALKPLIANKDKPVDLVRRQATVIAPRPQGDDTELVEMVEKLMRDDAESSKAAESAAGRSHHILNASRDVRNNLNQLKAKTSLRHLESLM